MMAGYYRMSVRQPPHAAGIIDRLAREVVVRHSPGLLFPWRRIRRRGCRERASDQCVPIVEADCGERHVWGFYLPYYFACRSIFANYAINKLGNQVVSVRQFMVLPFWSEGEGPSFNACIGTLDKNFS